MPAVMCTESIVSCGRTPWVARAERVERLAEREHQRGRVVAALADERDERFVLGEGGPRGPRQRLLLGELGRRGDELAQRLEEAELQVGGLAEERVDVRRELLEVDPRGVAEVAARAQRERALAGARALPEPGDHGLHPTATGPATHRGRSGVAAWDTDARYP